jgi:hypothetical protein
MIDKFLASLTTVLREKAEIDTVRHEKEVLPQIQLKST